MKNKLHHKTKQSYRADKKRFIRQLVSKEKKRVKNVLRSGQINDIFKNSKRRTSKKKIKSSVVTLRVPKNLDLSNRQSHEITAKFLKNLREIVIIYKKKVRLDFRDTENTIVAGTLALMAEIDRAIKIRGTNRCIISTYPTNNKVGQVLQQIGFFQLLGMEDRFHIEREDVRHWHYVTDTTIDGPAAGHALEKISKKIGDSSSSLLFRAVSEAMSNSVEHAYIINRTDRIQSETGRWWMFGQLNDNRELSLAFCDLGVGIPRTIPKLHKAEIIINIFKKLGLKAFSDSNYIHGATEIGRTRTGKTHRGKGLKDIMKIIDEAKAGSLVIFSNKGVYRYSYENDSPQEQKFDYKKSIMGTIIQWHIPIDALTQVSLGD